MQIKIILHIFQTHIASSSGTYRVEVTDSNKCSSKSLDFVYNPSSGCITPTLTLSGNTATASTIGAYQWLNCNTNAVVANAISKSYTATSNGSYKVIVTNGACKDTSTCVTISTTGIQQQTMVNELNIYPNPGNGKFIVSSTYSQIKTIEIYNVLGKLVWREHLTANTIMIDISEQPKGIYFYKVSSDNNMIKTGKLIMQ